MRKIDYCFLSGKKFESWRERAYKARESILEDYRQEKQPIPWKKTIWKALKEEFLLAGNHGKCMYCEGRYVAGSYGDAEHYRPKAKVTENGKKN